VTEHCRNGIHCQTHACICRCPRCDPPKPAAWTASQVRNLISCMSDAQVLELWDKLKNMVP
jgi:hypothetical protein